MLKQVGLIPSGNQLWYQEVLSVGKKWVIYCSTISVYVFDLKDYLLQRILTGHLNSITCITVSPFDDDQIATTSTDQTIRIWDVNTGRELKKISTTRGNASFRPNYIDWHYFNRHQLLVGGRKGEVRLYDYQTCDFQSFSLKSDKNVSLCKFHPQNSQRAVVALENKELLLFDPTRKRKSIKAIRKFKEASKTAGHVVDVQFDPLSKNYFIAATSVGSIHLFDIDAPDQYFKVRTFLKAETRCCAWVKGEPGNFLVGDSRSGALKLFNVSSETPEKIFNLRKSPCLCIKASKEDPNIFAVSFKDGVIGVYNHKDKRLSFSTEPGHTETIFGCAYSLSNPNIFATSSYDSMVKLWDTRTMKCIADLVAEDEEKPDERVIIYSVAWHPRLPLVAASLGSGKVWIWDSEERYPTHKLPLHTQPVYKVAWNQVDHNLLATASKDKSCVVCHYGTGKVLKNYKHPAVVFGVDWSPHSRNILATGCYDLIVRVFNISTSSTIPIKKLHGHTKEVYNVRWHPTVNHILMSGSNDHKVRIWNTETGESKELSGHTNNVRALEWNSEIPHLCLSGSWDGTIRIWDLYSGKCVSVITDHHADVYGLSYHPHRPFIYGSTSRDTTIRFWSLEPLLQQQYLKVIVRGEFGDVIGSERSKLDIFGSSSAPPVSSSSTSSQPSSSSSGKKKGKSASIVGGSTHNVNNTMRSGLSDLRFRGPYAKELCEELKNQGNLVGRYQRIFDYLFFPSGTSDLFQLLSSVVTGEGVDLGKSMTHYTHVGPALETRAKETEREGNEGGGIGSKSREEMLADSAELYLRVGNLRKYCEILVELGRWEKAISVSPGVSIEYWRDLSSLYAQHLEREGDEDAIPHYISARHLKPALDFFIRRKQYEEANVISMTDYKLGKLGRMVIKKPKRSRKDDDDDEEEEETEGEGSSVVHKVAESFFMRELSCLESMMYQRKGMSFHASCCFFRINDVEQGIRGLVKGCELLHAFAAARVLKILHDCPRMLEVLCRTCLRLRQMDILVILLSKLDVVEVKQRFICQIQDVEGKELESMYRKAGLQSPSFYTQEAKRLETRLNPEDSKTISEVIRLYALGKNEKKSSKLALNELKRLFNGPPQEGWDWEDIERVIQSVYCIDLRKVEADTKHQLLGFANFIGSQKAVWKGFYSVAPFMSRNCKVMFKKVSESPIDSSYLDFFICYTHSFFKKSVAIDYCNRVLEKGFLGDDDFLSVPLKQMIVDLESGRYDPDVIHTGRNVVYPTGSKLPVRIVQRKVKKSFFSGDEIRENPIIRLPDNKYISLSDACMYYECNPFSPLNDGDILLF